MTAKAVQVYTASVLFQFTILHALFSQVWNCTRMPTPHTWHLSAASSAAFQSFLALARPSRTSRRAACSSRTADVSPVAPSAIVVPRLVSPSSSVALLRRKKGGNKSVST